MRLERLRVSKLAVRVLLFLLASCVALPNTEAQGKKIEWTNAERPIVQTLRSMRGLPDDVRAKTTKVTALEIRKLPAGQHKVMLASGLASLSTEGDFGKNALQEVTTTLALAVRETPQADEKGEPAHDHF